MTKQQRHQRYPQVSPSTSAESLPFVIIENEKFYPDRFYLNAPTGLSCYHPPSIYRHQGPVSVSISVVAEAKHTAGRPTTPAPVPAPAIKLCPCQIRQQKQQQQPLFDRSKLVQSLDLKAAIIGTYSLDDPKTLTHEFPKLFQPEHPCGYQVPTLFLHGVKDLERIFKGEKSCRVSAEEEYSKERELQAEDRELRELFREFLQKKQRQVQSLKDGGQYGKYKGTKANMEHEVIEIIDDDDDDIDNYDSTVDNNKIPKYKAASHQKLVSSRETKRKDISLLAKLHNKKLFQMPSKNNLQSSSTTNSRKKMRTDEENRHKSNNHSFGEYLYFSKVQTKFLPPGKFHPRNIENHDTKRNGCMNHNIHNEQDDDIVVILDDSDSDNESGSDDVDQGRIHEAFGIRSEISRCRQNMQGVHHPKYMLLFENSGSVVVVVSSANMTSQKSADASWIQRFPPCIIDSTSGGGGGDFHDVPVQELRDRCDGSDFGHVLADFLQKQSEAVEEGEILPIQFLRKYVGRFDTLEDFRKRWRFDSAIVHLVSTVPGYHPGRFTTEHLAPLPNGCRRILYGPQRVADILHKLSGGRGGNTSRDSSESNAPSSSGKEHQRHWLPQNVLSDNDRLIIQTTSFGAKWTSRHLEELARQHMGYDGPHNDNDNDHTKKDGQSLLDKVDIIWPSMSYLESIRQIYEESSSPGNAHDFHHFLFLRSEGFNSSDLAVCSQMKLFEDSCPLPLPLPLTPHIKTYARLLLDCTNDNFCKRHYHRLAWVMISSACFSRGAQGYTLTKQDNNKVPPPVVSKRTEEDMRAYSNFELGILFVSRLQGNPDTDRIYVSYNTRTYGCQCDENVTTHQGERLDHDRTKNTYLFPKDQHVKEIPMPFPFCLSSRPYQLDQEDAVFSETPFFHQMTRDSISSGFCSLTPFGQWCSSRFSTSTHAHTHDDDDDQKK